MTKLLFSAIATSLWLLTSFVHAAPGETWDVVTKSNMSGMENAIPDAKQTVCMTKGENNPLKAIDQGGDCKLTDVKTSSNKISWKMSCDIEGSIMSGVGEIKQSKDSYQGVAKLNGQVDGQIVNLTSNYQGKRIGASCDTSSPPVAAMAGMENMNEMMGMAKSQMVSAMAEQCEITNYETTELISSRFFGPTAACPNKEKFACKIINKEAQKKIEVYAKLIKHDDTSDVSISDICGINMTSTTKAICKNVNESNYQEFEEYCPEAEAFASAERSNASSTTASGNVGAAIDSTARTIDSARKLKGMFGF